MEGNPVPGNPVFPSVMKCIKATLFFLGEVSFLCRLGIEACLSGNILKEKNNLFSSNKEGPLHNEFLFDRDGHF